MDRVLILINNYINMPITSSAKKALRASKKKRVYNLRRSKAFQDIEKKIKKLVSTKKFDEAKTLISSFQKSLDKASKSHTISKNKASRKKSRIVSLINKGK
jgi:small subunit ribosomal protein S20